MSPSIAETSFYNIIADFVWYKFVKQYSACLHGFQCFCSSSCLSLGISLSPSFQCFIRSFFEEAFGAVVRFSSFVVDLCGSISKRQNKNSREKVAKVRSRVQSVPAFVHAVESCGVRKVRSFFAAGFLPNPFCSRLVNSIVRRSDAVSP